MTDEELLTKYSWLKTVGEINDEEPYKSQAIEYKLALLRSFETMKPMSYYAAKALNDMKWDTND